MDWEKSHENHKNNNTLLYVANFERFLTKNNNNLEKRPLLAGFFLRSN